MTHYKAWNPGEWASKLPESYFSEMGNVVDGMLVKLTQRDHDNGYFDYLKARNVFGRMEICQTTIMPWVLASIDNMADKTVMEAGCGSGSATVPLAMVSKHVYPMDLDAVTVDITRKRCALLDLGNVSPFVEGTTWIDRYAADPRSVCDADIDVVVSYALMEHLLPVERLNFLIGAWKHLPIGGHLVLIEAPNRLAPFDWHSAQMHFTELPDELFYLWNAFSPRPTMPEDIVAHTLDDLPKMNRDRSYRFGRGASYHEFDIAIGRESYEVVSSLNRRSMSGTSKPHIDVLSEQLAEIGVHPGFAYPSLDLVIKKTGPSRL